jgi:hypothetical protein
VTGELARVDEEEDGGVPSSVALEPCRKASMEFFQSDAALLEALVLMNENQDSSENSMRGSRRS